MSDDPNNPQPSKDWEEMLRSMLGDEAAERILGSMNGSGLGFANIPGLGGANFAVIGQQLQHFFSQPADSAVNWDIAERVARETVNSTNPDRLVAAQGDEARSSLRTASLWLDSATSFDPPSTLPQAWSRTDWIKHSLATFKELLNPVGENIARAMSTTFDAQIAQLPEEMQGFLPNPDQILAVAVSSMLGMQYGQALAQLATSSFGSSDTGLPLIDAASAALVPSNVNEFATGLTADDGEVLTYVATRELAAARLFANVPWLRARILDTVAQYASEIVINTGAIEEQLRGLPIDNPEAMQTLDLTDIFELELSSDQAAALARLEHLLSLVEGWVTAVSERAVLAHLPHAVSLQEMFTRRYATDNPARHVWEEQLGMTLTPRQLRDAVKFWQLAESKLGPEGRDQLWSHPDLLPTPEALASPQTAFDAQPTTDLDAELDSFLADLFAQAEDEAHTASEEQADGETPAHNETDGDDEDKGHR